MAESTAERKRRPRDSGATKALLLQAATEEFAEYGLAGARIDRIAERAGVNKRLIYVYFGDKDALFDAVVDEQARTVVKAVPLDAGDLTAFAASRFDYVLANPAARRIAIWRGFERAEATEAELASYRERVELVEAAQREGRLRADIPAVDLFAIVLRMTESWLSAPAGLRAAAGEDADRLSEHRAALLAAVRSVVEPRG
ncbi:TetR family transcriptional regulator [Kribbella pratensis]|jgi:AcrR family transcriptional regulator|uniref:TetR family transcriptional regulator n=1 Tax=Kribbella pratensis TaxID=2512112 RepID=A0A4R8C878_9ACTN|nr:TetR family transcriptional regulator [Kribbella pratensis]TDW69623.1 TetR family transcriptional regulator [Kribbella pratensis]